MLLVFLITILTSRPSENWQNQLTDLELPELCKNKSIVNQEKFNANLANFYEGINLGYGHRNTKVEPIPQSCLENLSVKVFLYKFRLNKAKEFQENERHYNDSDTVKNRYQLTPIAPKSAKDNFRYKKDFN